MKDISYIILCWSLTLCMLWVLHKPPVQIVCANTEDVRLELLSKVINAEFNPDDIEDAFLIGSTVLNRVELDGFPSTTDSVILQENQYYGVGTNLFYRTPISDSVAEKLLDSIDKGHSGMPHEQLSDREFDVLKLIASGKSVTEIAENLSLSVNTISTYRMRLLDKMKMKSSAELTHYAISNHLLE